MDDELFQPFCTGTRFSSDICSLGGVLVRRYPVRGVD